MKPNLNRLALLALVSMLSLPVYAQAPRGSSGLHESDKSKRAPAQNADLRRAKSEEDNEAHDGAYWFSRGYELHQSDRYVEAIEAFSHSIKLNHRQATSMYNVACGFALLSDKDNALFWLERSLEAGFDQTNLLRSDSDLDSLRSDPQFKELMQRVAFTDKESKTSKEKSDGDRLQQALKDFDALKRESSNDGYEWYRVGSRLIRMRDYDRATIALTQAVDHLGYAGSSAMYNLACAYALKGDRERGLDWLEKSINAGFDDSTKLEADPDIASLRSEARFKKIEELSRTLSLSQFNNVGSDGSQYSKQRWAPAIKLYQSFVREQPNNGRGWFDLGYALHYSSEHAKAAEAFERAVRLGYRTPTSMYNVACAQSMMNHRDAAFEWLDKAVAAGFELGGYVRQDEDLDNLRSDPRFKRFLEMADEGDKDKEKQKEKRKK
ncbi:MAG TPA: tetratricopeptide repeat protein [Blastocatellia bacterium]|nr:tetratricopeptide repeat protein [Blastocatellia bacterium]